MVVSDTNGAGDTFLGAVLAQISGVLGGDGLTESKLREFLLFANKCAAKTCSRPGAIPAMPTMAEMLEDSEA